jgi:ankyrin repeat protein
MVIRLGADVNSPSYWGSWHDKTSTFPFHFAVRKTSFQMVKALLNAGADVHKKDKTGQTALQHAVNLHHEEKHIPETTFLVILEIISLLRNTGATCGTYTPWSWSPLPRDRRVAAAYRGARKRQIIPDTRLMYVH